MAQSNDTYQSDYQRAYRQKYKDQARRVNLTFALSEISAFERGAAASGQPLAQFVKGLAMQGLDKQAAPLASGIEERLDNLDRLVRNIANNVNQMARHSNRLEQVLDEQEVLLHLRLLEQELRKAIQQSQQSDTEQGKQRADDTRSEKTNSDQGQ